MQDAQKIKERIIFLVEQKGPTLPVEIAKELNLSILFASVFLSELLSEKKLKISYLRVGNSPVYFISGQEIKLENFSEHLNSKEKEAFLLLKENKFLEDSKQEPAIRVALRSIKDFAFPFENNGTFFWRYLNIPESEFPQKIVEEKIVEEIDSNEDEKLETSVILEQSGELEESENLEDKKISVKKSVKKRKLQKQDDKFFNQVKNFLTEKSIEILSIEGASQKDLMLRIKQDNEEKLVVAYNKKRIGEIEIIKANKKAVELDLKYFVLSLGELPKKLQNLIEALGNLSGLEKLK